MMEQQITKTFPIREHNMQLFRDAIEAAEWADLPKLYDNCLGQFREKTTKKAKRPPELLDWALCVKVFPKTSRVAYLGLTVSLPGLTPVHASVQVNLEDKLPEGFIALVEDLGFTPGLADFELAWRRAQVPVVLQDIAKAWEATRGELGTQAWTDLGVLLLELLGVGYESRPDSSVYSSRLFAKETALDTAEAIARAQAILRDAKIYQEGLRAGGERKIGRDPMLNHPFFRFR